MSRRSPKRLKKPPAPRPAPPSPPPATTAAQRCPSHARWLPSAICLGLVLLVAVPYAQVGSHEFLVCDDNQYIYENPRVCAGLTWEGVKWAFEDAHAGNWHPVTWLSHMADCQFLQKHKPNEEHQRLMEAAGRHHLVSAAIHALSAVLLFLALHWLTGALWPAAVVAALFAVHPLRVESVAWAAERKDVLSGLFFMLTLLSYAWYATPSGASSVRSRVISGIARYSLVLLSFAMGLMSKSMLVTLPCVLLMLDVWPLRRWGAQKGTVPFLWRPATKIGTVPAEQPRPGQSPPRFAPASAARLLLEKLPMFAMVLPIAYMTMIGQKEGGALNALGAVPLHIRVPNALVSYVAYLWQTIWPAKMAIFYAHPGMLPGYVPATLVKPAIVAAVILAVLTFVLVWFGHRRPYLLVGWLWYLGMLVPVIGLIQVGIQARADRYTYLPSIGIYLLLVWALTDLAARWRHGGRALMIATPAVLLILTIITYVQVSYWKDNFRVFEHAVEVTENNYFAYNHLGLAYDKAAGLDQAAGNAEQWKADVRQAAVQYEKAIKIKPDYDFALNNLGVCFANVGKYGEAAQLFTKAVTVNPKYGDAFANLGVMYLRQDQLPEAEKYCLRALELHADKASNYDNLALVYEKQGILYEQQGKMAEQQRMFDEAITRYTQTLQLDPYFHGAHRHLGILFARRSQLTTATTLLERALQIDPQDVDAYLALANVAENQGDLARTEAFLQQALHIKPDQALARQMLELVRLKRAGGK